MPFARQNDKSGSRLSTVNPCLVRLALLILVLIVCPRVALSEGPEDPAGQPTASVSAETLERKITEVQESTSLNEATKAKLLDLYRKALGLHQQARADLSAAEAFQQAREKAPAEAAAVRERTAKARESSPLDSLEATETTPLEQVAMLLLKEKADLAAVEAKLADLKRALADEVNRPGVVRELLTEARQEQENLVAKRNQGRPAGEPAAVTEARGWLLESENQAFSAAIQKLDQELLSQPMRVELLQAQRDRNAHNVEWIGKRVAFLENLVSNRRLGEAERARSEAEAARLEAAGKHPLIRNLAEQNAVLSQEVESLAVELEQVTAGDDQARSEARRIADQHRSTRQKLNVAGMSQVLGQVLLEQRRRLPALTGFRKDARDSEDQIAAAGLRQLQLDDERSALQDVTGYVNRLLVDTAADESLRQELLGLAENRLALLEQAETLNQTYLRALGELDFARRQLRDAIRSYVDFLDENLLWIRSAPKPDLSMLNDLSRQVRMFFDPVQWTEVTRILLDRATASPAIGFAVALGAVLLWRGRRLKTLLRATGEMVGKTSRDSFLFTARALLYSLLLALPWSLVIFVTGWEIAGASDRSVFATAVSRSAIWVSEALLYLNTFSVLCLSDGLFARHFRWPEETLRRLRLTLRRFMVMFLPAAFVTLIAVNHEIATMGGVIGRIGFVVVAVSLSLFFYQLLRRDKGALQPSLDRAPGSVLARFRRVWLASTVTLSLALAVLGLAGYLYTAGTLTGRFIDTMWITLTLVVIHQLAARWLTLVQHRLALRAALERRAAARAAAEESAPGAEDLRDAAEEKAVDLAALSEDTRKLMNAVLVILGVAGIWLIWSPVLPAFRFLDEVTLWHHTGLVDGEETLVPTTLGDVGLALLILAITVVATKRFPALIEIILLQRLKMTSGARYAAISLYRYVIAAVGAWLVFTIIGASWGELQWLVAALGVGIGFGLQEIVANFISGLIILFERPIRVGDIVTVGDTDGVVTRIQIRATTIRNWERKELLVPNKEFITGRLLNWSLSDQTTRILITVGLAYGGDVQKAMALMAEAAEEHERILADPAPFVAFEGFGDNALVLILRCYTNELDFRLATTSELHQAIHRKFNDAGLVIAFPQRDVHLDTSRPLQIVLRRDKGPAAEKG